MTKLETLAYGVLFPSIGRPALPRWLAPCVEAGLGGVILYGRDIHSREQVAELTSALHALRDHVIIATDEEGGDVTRLEGYGGTSVPGNYALGRIDDLEATRAAAEQIGLSLVDAGIDWNLGPAVDVISNPLTPNAMRTFGDDRARVSAHSAAWVQALQATGVSACAKHFPGTVAAAWTRTWAPRRSISAVTNWSAGTSIRSVPRPPRVWTASWSPTSGCRSSTSGTRPRSAARR